MDLEEAFRKDRAEMDQLVQVLRRGHYFFAQDPLTLPCDLEAPVMCPMFESMQPIFAAVEEGLLCPGSLDLPLATRWLLSNMHTMLYLRVTRPLLQTALQRVSSGIRLPETCLNPIVTVSLIRARYAEKLGPLTEILLEAHQCIESGNTRAYSIDLPFGYVKGNILGYLASARLEVEKLQVEKLQ